MHLQDKTFFNLDLGFKVKYNVVQYPQHHVTDTPTKFEGAMLKGLRRRCIYKKTHYLALTLGPRSQEMLPSTLYIMLPMHL